MEVGSNGKGRGGAIDALVGGSNPTPAVVPGNNANGSTAGRASPTKMQGVGIAAQRPTESRIAR